MSSLTHRSTRQSPIGLGAPGRFRPADITIPVGPLLRIQGYKDLTQVRPDVRRYAEEAADRAESLIAPEAAYREVSICSCDGSALELQGGLVLHSSVFHPVLARCREVVVFALTLGSAIDDQAHELLARDEVVQAVFLETASWIAMERATKLFALHLASTMRPLGLELTRRLGPGYGDWRLSEQKILFRAFAGMALPVTLLESDAMLPKMSRSGLYGLRTASRAHDA